MKESVRRSLMIASVVALTLSARAQFRVGNDGRALDANPRVGSGGMNSGGLSLYPSIGNQIITGNVTGNKQFRGMVPYTDPGEFRGGYSSDSMDSFIKRSGGYSITRTDNPNAPQAFYGGRLANPGSSAFVGTGIAGTYTPATSKINTQINPSTDTRVGPIQSNESIVLPSGDIVLPGPYDPITNQITLYTASAAMGIRAWSPAELGSLNASLMPGRIKLDDLEIAKFRNEINNSVKPGLSGFAPTPLEAPGSTLIKNDPLNSQVNVDPLGASVAGRIPGALLPAYQQSSQNAELEKRLNSYYSELLQTQDAKYAQQLKDLQSRMPADKDAAPSSNIPDYPGIGRTLPREFPSVPSNIAPKTLTIDSLAAGVTAPGLAQLLKQGEDLSREGKYEQAMETFAAASQVAPNNYLSVIGVGHAALAGGYFKKAEASIRAAYVADPALLMAKFNLKKMLGEQTLPNVVAQLKQAANSQQDDAGLAMLLCYVSYHSDYVAQAAIYLDLAEKRSNGQDAFYPYLRAHWKIPTTPDSLMPAPMEQVIKQIEAKNVASIKLSEGMLLGSFRKAVDVNGKMVLNFTSELQKGAAGASTLKWIRENGENIKLNLGE